MCKYDDFVFNSSGWDNNRWELRYKGESKNVEIPEELIKKAEKDILVSFSSDTEGILSISIPKNITDVWFGTFYKNHNLENITVDPDSPYLTAIDGVLFSKDMKRLIYSKRKFDGEYIIPDGVEEIMNFAFSYSNLEKIVIPKSVTTIRYSAFEFCKNLKSAIIPEGVKELDNSAFRFCTALDEFEFLGETEIRTSFGVLDKKYLEDVISGEGFDVLSEAYLIAFIKNFKDLDKNINRFIAAARQGERKKVLEYLLLKKPAKKPRKGTFEIKPLNETEAEIIKYKGREEEIVIPEEIDGKKIVSIGEEAFKNKDNLIKIVIPEGVTEIKYGAFKNDVCLEEVVLPSTCTVLGKEVFMDCKTLSKINLPEGIEVLQRKVFYNCFSLKELILPNTLKEIQSEALYDCRNLNSLDLPKSLTTIGRSAFYACGFNHGPQVEGEWAYSISEFTIPPNVTKIDGGGSGVFAQYAAAEDKFGVFEYKMKLRVVKGSEAHKFAVKNKIRFTLVKEDEL